jgi:hypothetical protein
MFTVGVRLLLMGQFSFLCLLKPFLKISPNFYYYMRQQTKPNDFVAIDELVNILISHIYRIGDDIMCV